MKKNVKPPATPVYTAAGGKAMRTPTPELDLQRAVMATMLWEDAFYEDGESISDRIKALIEILIDKNKADYVNRLALTLRGDYNIRHTPLFMCVCLARLHSLKAATLTEVIQRPDEIGEFLSLYFADGKIPLAKQVKLGLARAFDKFDEYQFSKWDQNSAKFKLRDVMFLVHPKPANAERKELYAKIADQKLGVADTWETELSAGKDKKSVFTRLLNERKLGGMALLKNLRGMAEAGVEEKLMRESLKSMRTDRILPFRFITAARHAPRFERELEEAMFKSLADAPKLPGKTVVIVDASGSMHCDISSKSQVSRFDAAASLTMLLAEICETVVIYATAGSDSRRVHDTKMLPPRRGFAMSEALQKAGDNQGGGGIFLVQCTEFVEAQEKTADRLIVLTDEADCDHTRSPKDAKTFADKNYLINVGSYENGIGYGAWTHIDGFSEAAVRFIQDTERLEDNPLN